MRAFGAVRSPASFCQFAKVLGRDDRSGRLGKAEQMVGKLFLREPVAPFGDAQREMHDPSELIHRSSPPMQRSFSLPLT